MNKMLESIQQVSSFENILDIFITIQRLTNNLQIAKSLNSILHRK